MDERTRYRGYVFMIAGLVLAVTAVLALASCSERRQPGSHDHAAAGGGCCPPAGRTAAHEPAAARPSGERHAPASPPVVAEHEHAAAKPSQAKPAVLAQTTCPVMGGAINKAIFVEYQGRKVYFCCKGCDQTFQQNPEKYLAKLPQFQD